jgi:hypothetical protein
MSVILTSLVPDRIDTQSSPALVCPVSVVFHTHLMPDCIHIWILKATEGTVPVLIEQDEIYTWSDFDMLIPSVLGLLPGAVMDTLCTRTWLHRNKVMCLSGLSFRCIFLTSRLLQNANASN